MVFQSNEPLTQASTRNVLEGIMRPACKLIMPPSSVRQLSGQCGSLDVSEPYGPPLTVTRVASPFYSNIATRIMSIVAQENDGEY
jgi:hypothetical protein